MPPEDAPPDLPDINPTIFRSSHTEQKAPDATPGLFAITGRARDVRALHRPLPDPPGSQRPKLRLQSSQAREAIRCADCGVIAVGASSAQEDITSEDIPS